MEFGDDDEEGESPFWRFVLYLWAAFVVAYFGNALLVWAHTNPVAYAAILCLVIMVGAGAAAWAGGRLVIWLQTRKMNVFQRERYRRERFGDRVPGDW